MLVPAYPEGMHPVMVFNVAMSITALQDIQFSFVSLSSAVTNYRQPAHNLHVQNSTESSADFHRIEMSITLL